MRGDRWINGIVPYTIDPKFNSTERALISKAFKEYANKTCIRFVPKTNQHSDYVDIQLDNKECGLSNICRNGGKQFAKIGRQCMNLNTILHELGHSICLAHEHTRMDREDFIELTNKSDKNDRNNQVGDWRFTTLGLLYDYESVMHYDCPYFFKPKSAATINCGKTERLSVLDAEKINSLYECEGKIFMDHSRIIGFDWKFYSCIFKQAAIPTDSVDLNTLETASQVWATTWMQKSWAFVVAT